MYNWTTFLYSINITLNQLYFNWEKKKEEIIYF